MLSERFRFPWTTIFLVIYSYGLGPVSDSLAIGPAQAITIVGYFLIVLNGLSSLSIYLLKGNTHRSYSYNPILGPLTIA